MCHFLERVQKGTEGDGRLLGPRRGVWGVPHSTEDKDRQTLVTEVLSVKDTDVQKVRTNFV